MARSEKIIALISRLLGIAVGGIFVYAGIVKALDPAQFAIDISNYRLLPWSLGATLALYLPWLEILGGGALILKKFHPGAPIILTALSFTFLAALGSAKLRGLDITCGCFGHTASHSIVGAISLDVALLFALAFVLSAGRKKQIIQTPPPPSDPDSR
jgi:hypothetical protein